MARYLEFFHAAPVQVFNVSEYRRNLYGISKDAEWLDDFSYPISTNSTITQPLLSPQKQLINTTTTPYVLETLSLLRTITTHNN